MKKFLLAMGLACALPPTSVVSESSVPLTNEELADLFMETARKREFSADLEPIVKWERESATAAIVFEPKRLEEFRSKVGPHIRDIAKTIKEMTGFEYEFSTGLDAQNPANVFVVVGTPRENIAFARLLEERIGYEGYEDAIRNAALDGNPACGLASTWNDQFEILSVAIAIDITEHSGWCVNKLFTQSVGLFNDPVKGGVSILSDERLVQDLTISDLELLTLLYSGKFSAGDEPSISQTLSKIQELRGE